VRQQVLYMFNDSQALGQGLTPSSSTGGFRPFVCGSNTYGRKPEQILLIPTVLNENLRCLKMVVRPYETRNYNSGRNHVTHIPVWGTFGGMAPLQYQLNVNGAVINIFNNENTDPDTPNIFDGTSGGNAVDFNTTSIIASIGNGWNERMRLLTSMYSGLTSMGGDARNGPLLQFTRYCAFTVVQKDVSDKIRIPATWMPYIKEMPVDDEGTVNTGIPSLTKKTSKRTIQYRKIYAPPNSSILTQYSLMYSGFIPITPTHKENFCNLILPVIEIATGGPLPGITQVQTATQESYKLELRGPGNVISNRGTEIQAACVNYIKGQAGDKSELAEFVTKMSENNEGGFFGDLFAAIGPTAIAGLGTLLNTVV